MTLVLMRKSACNASYPNMHMIELILSIIIKPVQPTYHQININIPFYMITHAANSKVKANPSTWKMMCAGSGKIWFPCEVGGIPKGRNMSQKKKCETFPLSTQWWNE